MRSLWKAFSTNALLHLGGLLFLAASLSGCLSENTALDGVTSRPNSFAGAGSGSGGFNDGGLGSCRSNAGLATNQTRVTVQVPADLNPGGSEVTQGLVTADNFNLQVYRYNANLQVSGLQPTVDIKRDGSTATLTFPDKQFVPADIDLIVEANVNGQVYTAPLASANCAIRINPFSHYLVREGFGQLEQGTIDDLKSCSQTLCPAELIWPALVNQAQSFEIDIPENASNTSSLSFLDDRENFSGYIRKMTHFLRLSPANINSLDDGGVDADAFTFNSVYFGVELNQLKGHSSQNAGGAWATRTSTRSDSTNEAGTGFLYPNLTVAAVALELLDISFTSTTSTIPFQRRALNQDFERPDQDRLINEHSTAPGSAFVRNDKYLSGGRPVYQTVTRAGGPVVGWAPDPYVLDARIIGDTSEPQALLSGYFHAGRSVALSEGASGSLDRDQVLKDLNTAAFELNLRQTADDFSLQSPPDSYNVLSFELALNTGSTPVEVSSELARWEPTGSEQGRLIGSHSDSSILRISRDRDSGNVTTHGESTSRTIDFEIDRLAQRRDNVNTDPDRFRGHLFLRKGDRDYGSPDDEIPNGAASPDRRWLSFATSTPGGNQGLKLAVASLGSVQDLSGARFQIQGLAVEMTNDSNQLKSLNGACLALGDGIAELKYRGTQVFHSITSGTVFSPEKFGLRTLDGTRSDPDSHGKITMAFDDNGSDITLEGFVAPDGEALILRKSTNQSLGAVLALREADDSNCP